jgi:pyrroline-5-carboxylate reductase
VTTFALIGVGKLGEALLSGLLRAGRPAEQVIASERHTGRAREIGELYAVRTATPSEAVADADVVLLAVKPQDMRTALKDLAAQVTQDKVVVSMAAGITTALLEEELPAGTRCVRVMTNTPVFVDEAMSVVCAGSHATEADLQLVEELLRPVGKVIRLPEHQLDAVTALSGSGPAYFFYLVEAMIDAGILLGLPRAIAAELIVQTAVGSAKMLKESGEHPVVLREAVMSPAGTTISAIRVMEDHGVRAAMLAALEAARDRSKELGGG